MQDFTEPSVFLTMPLPIKGRAVSCALQRYAESRRIPPGWLLQANVLTEKDLKGQY